jgi:hypothetical protein
MDMAAFRDFPIQAVNRATAFQTTFVGRLVAFVNTRDHFDSPSISIANCAPVTRIVPSRAGGQAKPPSSSHLLANTMPVPSNAKIFKRSERFERKTKTSPL